MWTHDKKWSPAMFPTCVQAGLPGGLLGCFALIGPTPPRAIAAEPAPLSEGRADACCR